MNPELQAALSSALSKGIVQSVSGIGHVSLTGTEKDVYGKPLGAGEFQIVELRLVVPLTEAS